MEASVSHPLDLSIETTNLDLMIEEVTVSTGHFDNCFSSGSSLSSASSTSGSSTLSCAASLTTYACFWSTGS